MNYKVKVIKNNAEVYEDTLHITDAIPSVLNGKYPRKITPLTNTFMGGVLAFSDSIEKRNDNTFPFAYNKIGSGIYNSNNRNYTLTGIDGNLKTLCFSYKDTAEHYMETNYLVDGSIKLGYDTAQFPVLLDYENGFLYTLTDTGWQTSDMVLRKYKLPIPEITLNKNNWTFDYINYINVNELCELNNIKTIPHKYFSNNYNASGINFAELDGYDTSICNSNATSVIDYGAFNSHSITFNKKYIIAMCYFRYDNIYISSGNVIDTHSFAEFCLIDKENWEVIPFFLDEFGGDSQYRLCCADNEYIYIANGENSPNKLFRLSLSSLLEYAENNEMRQDKLGITRYITSAALEEVQPYDIAFCHTMNINNRLPWGSLNSYNNEELGLQIYNGTNGWTGIFKQAIAAIANFDIDLIPTDTLTITITESE